jgi:hypothetical protein
MASTASRTESPRASSRWDRCERSPTHSGRRSRRRIQSTLAVSKMGTAMIKSGTPSASIAGEESPGR